MTVFPHRASGWRGAWLLAAGIACSGGSHAQSSCSSDGVSRPVALLERFINADCAACWSDPATPAARRGTIALDWVLPGKLGDDAPLAAVALPGALQRLAASGTPPPPGSASHKTAVEGRGGRLRVAHGLPLSGYIGASMELRGLAPGAAAQPWTAWLALVETLPAGTEGSPVARNLVRNLVQPLWDRRKLLSNKEQARFLESRSMDIPAGTDTRRLRVVGWVQDAQGRLLTAAQSRCVPPR